MRILKLSLIVAGVLGMLVSLPALFFAALGFCGILADVSPGENRAFGQMFLVSGLPVSLGGLALLLVGLLLKIPSRARAHG